MKTLGIETSCDETAIAVYDSVKGIVGESIHSQMKTHAEYGGVVPELASRDHCSKIVNVLHDALSDIELNSVDQIAYTSGPGLLGALLIGESFAQGLSTALDIPLISVNHLEGHLMSPMMEFNDLEMPFICLLVSGGHSMIVDVKEKGDYEILGQSQDDAVGEAFDKVAKMLNLPYPGGPHIENLAKKGESNKYDFPRPMINSNDLNMSLSGLKTSVLYTIQKIEKMDEQIKCDIAAAFQQAVVDVLIAKIKKAVDQTGRSDVIIAGGVAANQFLREEFKKLENQLNINVYYPNMKYCGDNAAMIAFVGSKMSSKVNDHTSKARARWPLDELEK
tara:strand:- start:21 stop:1022 length:1002 start_codon:yes stop_codon:yes gene_type:complete